MILLLTDFHVADGNGAAIIVDAPAVLLDAVDALGVGTDIVDVHHQYTVVGVDVDVVGVVCRTGEVIAVGGFDKAFPIFTLLLEVHLTAILPLGIDNQGVILL